MDVILTHEQSDFDALAAALGAHLMNETAHAVLPRRMNRNVRAFLTLYGAELPFVDVRDLPQEPIETVTLVDTQSMITLKGMGRNTRVQVVDHHQLRPDLPEDWNIRIEQVGACTTLFVEGLREHNGDLNPIQATLLMLGIYEDTGSLSYTSTTPRDVRAAAALLEQGASLQIMSRYLNPPLTDEQRRIYNHLLSTASRHTFQGQVVLVARANAEDMSDEISTIAHKLRDLLDPDALFLVVQTTEGIRLVARSMTDTIDVAKVAEHFGGGGHERAAAALIRPKTAQDETGEMVSSPTLEEVHDELMQLLPEHVQPSLTVRQIMSPRPRVLSPDTPAEQAARLMQRYGYEGYPIVKDHRVQGLLTRRAVDRALAHKLNLNAASLMESGQVTVQPNDSIDHLRRVMIESGWGQVPVVDPDTEQVIGIVTRTDLIKTSDAVPTRRRQNLASRLDAALPPARLGLLKLVAEKAHAQRQAAYVVGGFVRDLLLGFPSPDFDVVVEGDAISLGNKLVACFGGRLITHNRFGTAKWTIKEIRATLAKAIAGGARINPQDLPESLDLISARTEFYDHPTALPTIERSSIKLDLHRRDFTINTMALRLDGRHYGELYDFWGGQRDLRRGLVRVLHSLSFVDDPTRMMRAVRFEQRFGFQIEERTLQLIAEARPMVRQVSGDRLRHEFILIFSEEHYQAMLSRLQTLNLLTAIHSVLNWEERYNSRLEQAIKKEPDPGWNLPEKIGSLALPHALGFMIWLAHYPVESAIDAAERLRLSGEVIEAIRAAKKLQEALPGLAGERPSIITARLDDVPPAALYLVYLLQSDPEVRSTLHHYHEDWRDISPVTDGNTLRDMNIPPGPQYRLILGALRSAWLDGEISSIEEEKQLLQEMVQHLPD